MSSLPREVAQMGKAKKQRELETKSAISAFFFDLSLEILRLAGHPGLLPEGASEKESTGVLMESFLQRGCGFLRRGVLTDTLMQCHGFDLRKVLDALRLSQKKHPTEKDFFEKEIDFAENLLKKVAA